MNYIDLFAGLGGIRLGFSNGFERAGVPTRCVFSSEIKDYAIAAYKGFYGQNEDVKGDITQIQTADIPDFDFLLAGFPCQPFSSAGNRLGFDDIRGTLFFEIVRILREKNESGHTVEGFLLENVEGLINHENGRTLRVIIEHLQALGYNVNYKLLDSRDFGLAQSRKRVYITGFLHHPALDMENFPVSHANFGSIQENGLPIVNSDFTRKLLNHYTVDELKGKAIKDKRNGRNNIHSWNFNLKGRTTARQRELLEKIVTERRKKEWAKIIGIEWMDGMPLTEEQIRTFFPDKKLHDMLENLKQKGYLEFEHPRKKVENKRVPDETKPKGYNIVAGKLSFEFTKIIDPDKIAPTLVAMDVSHLGVIDGAGIRKLSIREGQRLCGYPENYSLDMIDEEDAFDLLGNTVCVPVIEAIAERMGRVMVGQGNAGGTTNARAED